MDMNLSLNKLPWYGQVGAFVALALGIVAAFWYFWVQPAETALAAKRTELTKLQETVNRGLATTRRLPEFRTEVAGLQAQLERLRAVLPEERDVADLLRRVQAMATQSNLTIQGFTPQAVATREMHAEWPIGLKLEGTYHDLGSFLDRVSKFPRIINVNGLAIQARDGAGGGSTITAEATATTFVLIDPAAAGRGRGAGPARGRGAGRG
jgi:type IV pilus assembly protein PilO